MPILMTYGDSNTHGTPPIVDRGRYERFGPGIRWPSVTQAALGPAWELAEEGLPGRTAQFDDPVMGAHMNGRVGLRIALQTHGPIDVLTLMLGTNDAKARFSTTPEQIASGVAGLLDVATHDEYQTRHGGFKILLICPPPVLEQGPIKNEFFGARARSLALPPLYRALADNYGCGYLDAGEVIAVSPIDGVHYDEAAHHTLGQAVAKAVSALAA